MTTLAITPARRSYFSEGRHRSAIALLVGAAFMLGLIQTGAVRFYYTPLVVGLTYLAAAMVAGRRGALWAPGIITTCWGIAVLLGVHNVTHGSKASYELAGGIGIAVSLLLRYTVGLAAGFIGMVVAFGVILLHDNGHAPSWVFKGVTFGALLAVWGLWELRPARRAVDDSSVSTETIVDVRDKAATTSA